MSEVYEAVSGQLNSGEFSVCEKIGGDYLCRYNGKNEELSDSFIASGVIRNIVARGGDVYFVISESDLSDWDDDYDVSG